MNETSIEQWCVWRVYVLQPLKPRQRKQSVFIYRVGAVDADYAVERVRAELKEHGEDPFIVGVFRFSAIDAVVFDGSVTRTPEEVSKMKRL